MEKKLSKLIGITKAEFDNFVKNGDIKLRRANLIPTIKVGDEMALTSVLLSAMRLVKEFRRTIQSDVKISKGGQLFVYTEVIFPDSPGNIESRIDGLILTVQSGIIKDAAILEMKKGAELLKKEQIERYIEIAKQLSIPKLITVSNEFVSEPTQFPLEVKRAKLLTFYCLKKILVSKIAIR